MAKFKSTCEFDNLYMNEDGTLKVSIAQLEHKKLLYKFNVVSKYIELKVALLKEIDVKNQTVALTTRLELETKIQSYISQMEAYAKEYNTLFNNDISTFNVFS